MNRTKEEWASWLPFEHSEIIAQQDIAELWAKVEALARELFEAKQDARNARDLEKENAKRLAWWQDQFSSMNGDQTIKVAERLATLEAECNALRAQVAEFERVRDNADAEARTVARGHDTEEQTK